MKNSVCNNMHEIEGYKAGKPIEEVQREFGLTKVVKLASNENFIPLPAGVREAIRRETDNSLLYPDSDSFYLRTRIARRYGLEPENVVIGAGSVELIRIIIRVFLKPGEHVLTSAGGFSFYRVATIEHSSSAAFVETPLTADHGFDLDAMKAALRPETKIVFLTNPNNPTGTFLEAGKVRDFVAAAGRERIVVLDNAYEEYVDRELEYFTGLELLAANRNVVILKTFSKIHGLAGLRIGYGLAHPEMISYLSRLKAPFNVTRISQAAAEAALEAGDYLDCSYSENRVNRDLLLEGLRRLGQRPVPSQTNFLMFFPTVDVNALNQKLLRRGVIIRPLRSFGIPEAMRVTVRSRDDCLFFLKNLEEALREF